MGTYKVLQDIEAEDKLLGPLTLKQFIFAAITLACAYINFLLLTRGAALLTVFFVPPMVAFGFLAFPWSREQTTEVWLLAKIRFLVKPRKRIWDQNGLKDVVTITAPAKEEKNYTDGLSQGEVKSRLQALANTIDTRGWAIKNVGVNLFSQPSYASASSDRLVDLSNLPQEVSSTDITPSDDILDERNNPTAQHLDQMISATSTAHKEQLRQQMQQPAAAADQSQPANYWFLNQPSGPIPQGQAVFDVGPTVQPNSPTQTIPDDQSAAAQLQVAQQQGSVAYGNMRTLAPLQDRPMPAAPTASSKTPDPAILELAKNDDLNVATIARQANKNKAQTLGDDEVIVSLH